MSSSLNVLTFVFESMNLRVPIRGVKARRGDGASE